MATTKTEALQTAIRPFKATVDGTAKEKGDGVSVESAKHYDSLKERAAGFVELRDHLPLPIELEAMFSDLGMTDAQLLDLQVYLNQLVELTDLLDG